MSIDPIPNVGQVSVREVNEGSPANGESTLPGQQVGAGRAVESRPAAQDQSRRSGCLGLFFKPSTGSQASPYAIARSHNRPVSSCSGRIKTILFADQYMVRESSDFDAEKIRDRYGDLIAAFKDNMVTVPDLWLMLNYAYLGLSRQESETARKLAPLPTMEDQPQTGDVFRNLRVVRHNFDIPKYLDEFAGAMDGRFEQEAIVRDFARMGIDWLQDPFLVMENPGGEVVILDPHYIPPGFASLHPRFRRPVLARRFLAREIAASQHATVKPSPFFIEGGNFLADQNFLLVGADSFAENWAVTVDQAGDPVPFTEMRRQLCLGFGVDHILIPGQWDSPCPPEKAGGTPVGLRPQHRSLYHLDLFIALGGFDPVENKEVVFVAEAWELPVGGTKPCRMNADRAHCSQSGTGLNAYLDDIARWFEQLPAYALDPAADAVPLSRKEKRQARKKVPLGRPAFKVYRVPCFYDVDGGEALVSFVNCHIENYTLKSRRTPLRYAYLPHFGHAPAAAHAVYEMACKVYASAGFQVVPVQSDYNIAAPKGGSLHCVSKVMQRYPYDSSDLLKDDDYVYMPSPDDRTLWKLKKLPSRLFATIFGGERYLKGEGPTGPVTSDPSQTKSVS